MRASTAHTFAQVVGRAGMLRHSTVARPDKLSAGKLRHTGLRQLVTSPRPELGASKMRCRRPGSAGMVATQTHRTMVHPPSARTCKLQHVSHVTSVIEQHGRAPRGARELLAEARALLRRISHYSFCSSASGQAQVAGRHKTVTVTARVPRGYARSAQGQVGTGHGSRDSGVTDTVTAELRACVLCSVYSVA